MPKPPPRKFFQIHLSTAIVLMFVSGGIMWANVRAQRLNIDRIELNRTLDPAWYGFPFIAASTSRQDESDAIRWAKTITEHSGYLKSPDEDEIQHATSAEFLGVMNAYYEIPELIDCLRPERKESDIVKRQARGSLVRMTRKNFGVLAHKDWIDWWNGSGNEFLNQIETPLYFNHLLIGFNLVIALILLFAVWLLCEWLIRRRAVQKKA